MLCKLWPRPVETTHLLYPHRPVWGTERSPAFQRTGRRSQLLLHHLPQKKYWPITPKSATAHQTVTRGE